MKVTEKFSRSDLDIVYKRGYVEIQLNGISLGSEDTKHDAQEAIRNGEYDDHLVQEIEKPKKYVKQKKSSLIRLIKNNMLVFILMNDNYMSPDSRNKMTKVTTSNHGWVRGYFNLQYAMNIASKRNGYYDVYQVWVENGKINFNKGMKKMNDHRLNRLYKKEDDDEDY